MKFALPQLFWLAAVLLPLLGFFLFWSWRRRQQLIRQFVQTRLLATLLEGISPVRQKVKLGLLFATVTMALLALCRPQWGFDWEEARTQGLDIIVAIDTSKSMLARDIAPDRLSRAKFAALDLMKLAQSDRLGVIAFAGTAFLQCPLTLDEGVFRQSIDTLNPGIIPQGGTAVGEAIETATNAFGADTGNHRVLVLFTDGEDQDSGAIAAAKAAAAAGIKIFTIGVGTAEGEMLQIMDEGGRLAFLKDDQGNAVKSRLNETLLQEIATCAQGFYLPLRGANPMETLYQRGLAPLPRGESQAKLVKNYREQFRWPLSLALLLLVIEFLLPERKRRRPESNGVNGNTLAATRSTPPPLGLWLLLGLGLTASATASPQEAQKNYAEKNYKEALAAYQQTLAKKTNDHRLYFNAGDAAYRLGQMNSAQTYFETSAQSSDLRLQQQSYYNLGNTLFNLGNQKEDPKEKLKFWNQAATNFQNAVALNRPLQTNDVDAAHNLAFVQKQIEEFKKQQEQQQQQSGEDGDPNGEKKEQDEQNKDQQDQKKKQEQAKQNQKKEDQEKKDGQQQDQQKKDGQDQKQDSASSQDGKQGKSEEKDAQDSASQNQDGKKNSEEEKKKAMEEAKKQAEAQDKKDAEKKDGATAGQEQKDGEKSSEEGQEMVVQQMTLQQAMQFLDAQKQQQRTLIFAPPPKERKNSSAPLKDW